MENTLSPEQGADLQAHLLECTYCAALQEKVALLINQLAEMEEEVPFFLKNRLYHIAESAEEPEENSFFNFFRGSLTKWAAAAAGTAILFFNLFYFTDIFPEANRRVHSMVAGVEKIVAETGGWLERLKESKDIIFSSLFGVRKIGDELKNEEDKEVSFVHFQVTEKTGGYNG